IAREPLPALRAFRPGETTVMQPPRPAPNPGRVDREELQQVTVSIRKHVKRLRLGAAHQRAQTIRSFAQVHHPAIHVYPFRFDSGHPTTLSDRRLPAYDVPERT